VGKLTFDAGIRIRGGMGDGVKSFVRVFFSLEKTFLSVIMGFALRGSMCDMVINNA